ncbi:hypothetical protein QTP88_011831 [Uroleucon formosanum]
MNNRSDDKDEFETVAKETLDKIIEILEQDEINNTGSELIESVELDKLVEELDTFDEEIFNDKVGNKPISSDVLNKSLRLINLDEFENSPTTNVTRQGLRSNRNTIHTEYIQPKRTVKTKKMTGGNEMKPLNAIEAIKLIPDYSGQTEIYPFLNACEVIINTVDVDQQPFMLKMIAATKLSDRAFNATRYKEIKVWEDMKKILLDAFETPYAAANLQIELNIIKMRYDETICAYNNRVEEIYQKLCNAVAIDKTPAEAKILRNNIREQALVSYINGLNDKLKFEVKTKNPTTLEQAMQIAIIAEKNIRTYNDVQEIFRTKNTSRQEINSEFNVVDENFPIRKNGIVGNNFLSANNAVINLADKTLVINVNKNKQGELLLKPRSETIVSIPIAAKDVENKDIIIHKQEIMEGVICGNIINTVQNGKVIISILNITEMPQNVSLNNLNKIRYDHEFEYNTQPIINNDNKRKRINEIRKSIRSDHMDNEQRQSILEICEHYQDIFYLTGDTLTCTDTLTHKINIPENQEPIYKRPYRLPHAQMAEIDSQIKQMEKDDIIEPSFSPWNAPLLLVKKKLDASQIPKFRIVVDFRALNKVTINEYHPLPNITEILDQLGQCNLFSIIDLASGFYQIKLDEKSKELTAFSTNQGHWHFKKMAMGLKTSPCSFQRSMNNVMAGIVGIKCLVYLDDIIIYGKGLLDHNEKLRDVFERLRNHNLKIQPTKCEFLKQQCMYLGHIISENGIRPDPEKIKSVLQFPIPTSVKEIKSFLGLSGYYRKFIKSYSLISKPMTNLLRKDVTFNWDTSCQEAFDKLKNILCSEPILQYPDFTKPFIVTTDASGKALGAILSQGEISQDLPIAYASRTLSKCESNYSTTELECLAIIFAVKTFRPYLYGRKFIILSDHRALSWLFNLKDPLSKLARWRILLEEYDYEIKYKPGVLNSNVDALSRMYTIHEIKEESYPAFLNKFETQLITNKRVKEVNGSLIESPEEYHIVSEIEKHYNFMSGVNYEIKQKLGSGQKLAPSKEIGEVNYLRDKDRYIIFLTTKSRNKQKATYENIYLSLLNLKLLCEKHSLNKLAMNKLGFIDQLEWTQVRAMIRYVFRNTDIDVIICSKLEFTDEEKLMIFKQCHDSIIGGHVGIHRTIKKIKTQFNWRGLKEDVIEYIKNCESCQKGKVANKKVKQPMLITSTSSEPFEKIFLDIVGPLVTTLSGNTYILTLQDDLTKYSMGIALPNHQANTIAEAFVTNFVCTHGIPQTILTDQGTDFLSKIFTEVCKLLQINKINTSPFHPQTNGSLERSHRTLTEYLRHYVDKKLNNWDEYLPYAFFVYNSTEHTSTGYQPYSLLYGRRLEIPIKLSHEPEPRYNYDNYYFDLKQKMQESHKIAKENLIKRKVKSKQIYDNNENAIEIHVKDQILLRDKTQKNKLNPLWIGPYEVTDVLDRENIVILRGRRHVTVHKNNVKRFHENPS